MSIMKIPSHVLAFAGGEAKLGVYLMFQDYWNHFRSNNGVKNLDYQKTTQLENGQVVEISFEAKEEKMNMALKKEILRKAGINDMTDLPLEAWAGHPTLRWATFAVVSALVDMILPATIIDSIGAYTEVRVIGWGDSMAFDVESRDLFAVSKSGRGKRLGELHRQYVGQVTVIPENHILSVYTSLYRILAGKESLASLVTKVVRSMETALSTDVYNALSVAMAALPSTADIGLKVSGYTQDEFMRLAQTLVAYNGGARPVAVGTLRALSTILPADANYRYDLESDYVKLGYIRNFMGVDILALPQVADWENPFGLLLSDEKIWIISPSSQKLVKVVLEGSTLAYESGNFDNANLLVTSTMQKSWGTAIATNAIAAQIDLS